MATKINKQSIVFENVPMLRGGRGKQSSIGTGGEAPLHWTVSLFTSVHLEKFGKMYLKLQEMNTIPGIKT